MAEQQKTNAFASRFNRPESAPGKPSAKAGHEIPEVEPMLKKAGTYRLTPRAHQLIALAVNESRKRGRSVSKEDIVDQAVRKAYGHLDPDPLDDENA